jgi:hypothetical protein
MSVMETFQEVFSGALPGVANELQELGPRGWVVTEQAAHGGRDHCAAGLLNSAHDHAVVLRLDYHTHTYGLDGFYYRVGDLARQALLQLGPPGEPFNHSR